MKFYQLHFVKNTKADNATSTIALYQFIAFINIIEYCFSIKKEFFCKKKHIAMKTGNYRDEINIMDSSSQLGLMSDTGDNNTV